ncbi:hypothetical protein A2Y85_04550 [candidate division WOR-3 bacterium RBG_13_43_14]|uniref:Outer membrane protein beta-barrel domain-containing protein n=1 Tax=candidate division WOR-3 bacterium RBG_13_43_14 TaxID=1802590 RepID=A0A1F4UFR7_UNCW3|nr:MAG: hypothetical protein A2Y85_04550 [candidate division WOR-3 bacterium RBG_13_43_14]
MKKTFIILLPFMLSFAQFLPDVWSQSYCTYDIAEVMPVNGYSLGFSINNYCLWSHDPDSVSYDQRRFDLFAHLTLAHKLEFGIKYSYPTSGILELKYQYLSDPLNGAVKLGISYMKGTRIGLITDYVFDIYPTLVFDKPITSMIGVYIAPKVIYSIHLRDRQEHSTRPPHYLFQYGLGLGFYFGNRFIIMPESNWLRGRDEGDYTINQFGLAVKLRFKEEY